MPSLAQRYGRRGTERSSEFGSVYLILCPQRARETSAHSSELWRRPTCSGRLHGKLNNDRNLLENIGVMARPKRFELLTPKFVVWRSQVSNPLRDQLRTGARFDARIA